MESGGVAFFVSLTIGGSSDQPAILGGTIGNNDEVGLASLAFLT